MTVKSGKGLKIGELKNKCQCPVNASIVREYKTDPDYWSMSPSPAKYQLKKHLIDYDRREARLWISRLLDPDHDQTKVRYDHEVLYSYGYKELLKVAERTIIAYSLRKRHSALQDDIEDSLQHSLLYIQEKPARWTKTCEKVCFHVLTHYKNYSIDLLTPEGIRIFAFCRLLRSKYKNIIRSYVNKQEISLLDIAFPAKGTNIKLPKQLIYDSFREVDLKLDLFEYSTLTDRQKALLLRKLYGYNQQEIAHEESTTQQAISYHYRKLKKDIYNSLTS